MERLGEAAALVRGHPRHLVLFAAAGAMVAAVWAPPLLVLLAGTGALAAPGAAVRAAVVVAVGAGAWVADARRDAIDGGRLPARIGSHVELRVVVLEPARARGGGRAAARVRVLRGSAAGEPLLLIARASPGDGDPRLDAGDVVDVAGRVRALARFDRLHRRRGALAALHASRLARAGRRGGIAGALDAVRRRAERALAAGVDPPAAALVHGMVLGRDERVAPGVREAFRRSGLAHLLAASGMNVMLLAGLVLAACAATGVPLHLRLLLALAAVLLYVPVAGAGPSILRAGIVGAAGLVAALAGRPSSRWYALGLAALLTLALNPYAAAEPAWQLSFAAVAGLLAWARPLAGAVARRGVPAPVAEAAAVTVAASLATAPLLALHFGQVSLVSLPANLLAAPLVAPVMWIGTVAGLLGQAGLETPLALAAAAGAQWVAAVAAAASALPAATVAVAPSPLAAVATLAALLLLRPLGRLWPGGGSAWRGPAPAVAAAGAAVLAVLAVPLVRVDGAATAPPRPGETLISFLDVGQGDATLVQRDGTAVLVDTGPPDGPVLQRLRESGVERLDVLVITHAQSDHEGAALRVVRHLRPRVVVNGGAGWPSPVQARLGRAVATARGRVVALARGDRLRVGALAARALWPPRALAAAPPAGDPNDRALVLHVTSGDFDLLLPADAESDVTASIAFPRVEALKVAHHGSADPALPAFLRRTRPALAAIEVGRGNPYGHPAPATLTALRAVPEVRRTDRDGTVRLRVRPGGRWTVTTSAGGRR